MAKILLLLGALFLITTFGLHTFIISGNRLKWPKYTNQPFWMVLPWICGLILPVLAWSRLTSIPWGWLILLNFIIVFFVAPILAQASLYLFRRRRKIGHKIATTLSIGLICLITGLILK